MRLHLHRPAVDNAGRFVDAGTDIEVGNGPEQIGDDRALDLLATSGAIDPDEPEPDVLDLSADQHEHELSIDDVGADEFGVANLGR